MSGAQYFGLVVEQWTDAVVVPLLGALAEAIASDWADVHADLLVVNLHAHLGSAWLQVTDETTRDVDDHIQIAEAVAQTTASTTWLYWYNDTSAFCISATPFSPEGEAGEEVSASEETPALTGAIDAGADFARQAQDYLAAAIGARIDWPADLWRTDHGDNEGPRIISAVPGLTLPLAEHLNARQSEQPKKPKGPPPPGSLAERALDLTPSMLRMRATKLDERLCEVLAVLDRPVVDSARFQDEVGSRALRLSFSAFESLLKAVGEGLYERAGGDKLREPSAEELDLVSSLESVGAEPGSMEEVLKLVQKVRALLLPSAIDQLLRQLDQMVGGSLSEAEEREHASQLRLRIGTLKVCRWGLKAAIPLVQAAQRG